MNYFSLFFSLQMNRPIQVKPADSENRGGKNKRSNHSDFWKIRQEWNNLNRFLHSFEYFSLFFLAHHHHDRWSFKFFERREKKYFSFFIDTRVYMRAMLKIFRINIWLGICNNFQYFLKAIKPSPMETERGGIVQVAATICSLMVGQNIRAYAYITKALRYRSKGWIKKITGLIASNEIFLSNWKAFAI